MHTVTVDQVVLHVQDQGPKDGRVVMFANSLGTDLRVWDHLIPLLPQDLRIVRFDKPGHGLSDCPEAPYTMEQLVDFAEGVAKALDLSEITFVGLSIGGMIGQGLAAKRPDLLKALVLMDTAAKIGNFDMWNTRINAVAKDGIESLADAILERWFGAAFRTGKPEELAMWRNMLSRTPAEGYIGSCQAIAGTDLTDATSGLTLPVLAMAGDQDGSTPPELVQATAKLCGAEFHIIDGAGHLPCIEQPEVVAELIIDFLEKTN
ncbi:3-oxoadipate enol-lactonase [Donghicola tyrosinivorans]|uniref:3-oxoadipate enol-lactonase n=1 Tax=Donghicola tyrosinivorans TaxID=1652492 RepID=A0A2T0WMD1_9RHOB|nr:3-oxoadipate enol-lactonase [Donghicola tyrosinivorans]PRY87868.1 3-oxoadipate enol-lactonase [Donghicola tyrosinivorans]